LFIGEIPNAFAHSTGDIDLKGLYRNYNTDASKEASVTFDHSDDIVWKMFYIGQKEYEKCQYMHLWIYGRSWGIKSGTDDGYSHQIIIYNKAHTSGQIAYTFYSWELFGMENYQWQRIELDKSWFAGDSWNRIKIYDKGVGVLGYYGWQINNLQIGIDTTFRAVSDFDRSYWYSGSSQPPEINPSDCQGELMIALDLVDKIYDTYYFPELQDDWDDNLYNQWIDWVYLDYTDDKCWWRTSIPQNIYDLMDYGRLYVYGFARTDNPSQETYLKATVNNNILKIYPLKDYGECEPIGAWSWVEVGKGDLKSGENEFEFSDPTSWTHTNLAIPVFTEIDSQKSKWHWYDGQAYHGNGDYSLDDGELGVYLVLFDNEELKNSDYSIYTLELSNGVDPSKRPYDPAMQFVPEGAYLLGDRLAENYQWDNYEKIQQDYTQNQVHQGDVYSESENNQADMCSLLVFYGHGDSEVFWLPKHQSNGLHNNGDNIDFNHISDLRDFTEADYYEYGPNNYDPLDSGEDGFTYNADWVVFFACSCLGISGTPNENNAFGTLVYHGLHSVLGYYDSWRVPDEKWDNFIVNFYDLLTGVDAMPIIDAFISVSENNYYSTEDLPWAYFAHISSFGDCLFGQPGSISKDPDLWKDEKFEHKSDIEYHYSGE
jgi:hypothetical protein